MELNELRKQINEVDQKMVDLFFERMEIAENIAAYKKEHHIPILNREIERANLTKIMEAAGEENELYAYNFFSSLMDLSKARQAELLTGDSVIGNLARQMLDNEEAVFPKGGMIACQGAEGGSSQAACDRIFPRGSILYVKNYEAVFQAVQSGLCRYGILPIENSSNGSVRAVYSLLQKYHISIVRSRSAYSLLQNYHFSIIRSTRVWIHHVLIAKPGTKLVDVKTVYAAQDAIGQCTRFFDQHPSIRVVTCGDSAIAAKMAADDPEPGTAAIASVECSKIYGLEVLSEDVQDSDNNYTRFICIAKNPVLYEGANRISLIVSCDHKPGALHEMLSKPAALGLNLLKLESCPVTGRDFEFVFFIEFEASLKDRGVLAMLEDLERSAQDVWFLGNYSEV